MYDELVKALRFIAKQQCRVQGEQTTICAIAADAIEELQKLTDARPVVRARWIDTDNYYQRWKCSACGCHTRDAAPNYCPNCGADMREES
jgi:rubrerythrin